MGEFTTFSSRRFFWCLFSSLALLLIPGLAKDSPSTSHVHKAAKKKSSGLTGLEIFLVLAGLAAAIGLGGFLLYRYCQKKKRAEQHARLLKLFEQDDELEVELGIRD